MADVMNLADASALCAIYDAVTRKATVGRLARIYGTDGVTYGTARRICGSDGGYGVSSLTDVRDAMLEVRTADGDLLWRMGDLMAEYRAGEFVVDFDHGAYLAAVAEQERRGS